MVGVERWAELRRLHYSEGIGIRALARRTGLDRKTVRRALRSDEPPRYRRAPAPSKLDPFKPEIHRLLAEHPALPGTRIAELLAELGYAGGRSILAEYLREVRPLFAPPARTYQRTSYRPGEICQFDLWHPSHPIPVGFGQERAGYVVVACLGYSRVGAGALVFSKQAHDICWGMARCLWELGGVAATLVWDREGALHAGAGRASEALASFCGRLGVGWHLCGPGDAEAKGIVERLQGYLETNFEPGRRFANELDFQGQLDRWFARANGRMHATLRCRPAERLPEERAAMRPLPAESPDLDPRRVLRVPADPYVRVDTCDYSLDPALVGRRVEVRIGQAEITATALDSGQPAARHRRSFARHRSITDPAHAAALLAARAARAEPAVERRPLARYDELIPA